MSYISIIIPTFNRASVIMRAIQSVFNQTFHDYELIVVDDGSTDDTQSLLSDLIKTQKIKYIKQDNAGVSAARNLGAKNSFGEWLAFLDSDDEWLPKKLEEQILFLNKNENIQVVYGQEIWMRKGKRVNQGLAHQKYGGWIFDKCVQQCFIAPTSVMLKKKLFNELNGFNEEFAVCEDYDLWLKISSQYEIGYIDNPIVVKYGGHEDQLSMKFKAMDMWRLRSLLNIYKTRSLSLENANVVIAAMNEKSIILKNGYLKYENSDGVREVESIMNELYLRIKK